MKRVYSSRAGGSVDPRDSRNTLRDPGSFRFPRRVVDDRGTISAQADAAARLISRQRDDRARAWRSLHRLAMLSRVYPGERKREQSWMRGRGLEAKSKSPVDVRKMIADDGLRRSIPRFDDQA